MEGLLFILSTTMCWPFSICFYVCGNQHSIIELSLVTCYTKISCTIMGHRICYVNTNLLMKFDNMERKRLFIAIIACIEGYLGVVTLHKYLCTWFISLYFC